MVVLVRGASPAVAKAAAFAGAVFVAAGGAGAGASAEGATAAMGAAVCSEAGGVVPEAAAWEEDEFDGLPLEEVDTEQTPYIRKATPPGNGRRSKGGFNGKREWVFLNPFPAQHRYM